MHFLVTAGNRGIGLEYVTQLLERGDRVTTTAREPDEADALHELLDEYPDRSELYRLDVTDPDSVAHLERELAGETVDVLINNAGRLTRGGGPDDFDFQEIRGDFEVNAIGPLRVVEAVLPALRRADEAKIVNMTSKMGSIADNGSGGSYAYRMSKAALNMATVSLARDLSEEGIIAFVIHPGWVKTRMGGSNALITTERSVTNMLEVIDGATLEDSGEFHEWNGNEIPW